jgi:hypothetical protein
LLVRGDSYDKAPENTIHIFLATKIFVELPDFSVVSTPSHKVNHPTAIMTGII